MFNLAFAKPKFRPAINLGCLMDIPSGQYEIGVRGESILNGGLVGITGFVSRPNMFKTWFVLHALAMIYRAFRNTHIAPYDTEGTLSLVARWKNMARHIEFLREVDIDQDPRFAFTDISQYYGDEWFEYYSKYLRSRDGKEAEEKLVRTTPFVDAEGKPRKALYPTAAAIDSLSKFNITQVDQMYEKNAIGNSALNTYAMTASKAKSQMMDQLPVLCARHGLYMLVSGHIGDDFQMEMFPTDKRNLSFMKKDTKIKGGGTGIYSLPNNLWSLEKREALQTKDKLPEFPWDNSEALVGDTDLNCITLVNLRGKGGISGLPIFVVVSQSEGLLPALSAFYYCKRYDRFGIGGNDKNYFLELRPEVSLSRTKVRRKLQEDPKLARAAEFTAEILQMKQFHRYPDEDLVCDPKTLYEDLKAKGYDWDLLLNTRGYWVFMEEEAEHPQPFLSTMDLLRMRKGLYIPYWYPEEAKAKLNLTAKAG